MNSHAAIHGRPWVQQLIPVKSAYIRPEHTNPSTATELSGCKWGREEGDPEGATALLGPCPVLLAPLLGVHTGQRGRLEHAASGRVTSSDGRQGRGRLRLRREIGLLANEVFREMRCT